MYEIIQDFRRGLDTRKFKLTAPTGSLKVCNNGHITAGGEIEKRKAFTRTVLPSNSFGLVAISTGLVVFGSVAQGSLDQALPSNVTYQRLQHPDGTTAMTGVLDAKTFGDKTFVLAQFGSDVHTFYDGTIVSDFQAGLIQARWVKAITAAVRTSPSATVTITSVGHGLVAGDVVGIAGMSEASFNGQFTVLSGGLTADQFTFTSGATATAAATTGTASNNSAIAAAFAALVNETDDYTAAVNAQTNRVNVTGTIGRDFTGTPTIESVAGDVTDTAQTTAVPPVPGVGAVGGFRIITGKEGQDANIAHIAINGVTILGQAVNSSISNGDPVPFNTDAATTAADVAEAINDNPVLAVAAQGVFSASGALANGETVTIGAKVYTFQTVLTNVDGNVLIGADEEESIANLIAAINLAAGAGTTYAAATTANADVSASLTGLSVCLMTALVAGEAGNAIYIASDAANILVTHVSGGGSKTSLGGGIDAVTYTARANGDAVTIFHPDESATPNGYIVSVTVDQPSVLTSLASLNSRQRTGTTVTVTSPAAHRLSLGDAIDITGFSDATYNVVTVVTAVLSATSFQYQTPTSSTDALAVDYAALRHNAGIIIGNCSISFAGAAFTLDTLKADGVDLLSGFNGVFPTADETIAQFVERLAVAVNRLSDSSRYCAIAKENALYVSKLTTTSFDNTIAVAASLASGSNGTVVDGVVSGGLPLSIDKRAVTSGVVDSPATRNSPAVTVTVTEGTGPFQYNWKEVSTGTGKGITINNPTSQTTTFSRTPLGVVKPAYFKQSRMWPASTSYPKVTGEFICVVTAPDGTTGISAAVKVSL